MLPAHLRLGPQPRRTMIGAGFKQAVTNFPACALYNNSSGAHVLAVWAATMLTSSNPAQYFVQQGTIGTLQGPGHPMVTGDAALAGLIYTAEVVTVPLGPIMWQPVFSSGVPSQPIYPIFYLQPGWSLVVYDGQKADIAVCNFIWECLPASELGAPPIER